MKDENIEKALECCGKQIAECELCPYNPTEENGRRCYDLANISLDYINRLKKEKSNLMNFYKYMEKEVFEAIFRCVKGSISDIEYTDIILDNLRELAKIKFGIEIKS